MPAGKEQAYFEQMIDGQKAQAKPGEIVEVPGVGDSAWGAEARAEPADYYAVYLWKDNVTITTNGIGSMPLS